MLSHNEMDKPKASIEATTFDLISAAHQVLPQDALAGFKDKLITICQSDLSDEKKHQALLLLQATEIDVGVAHKKILNLLSELKQIGQKKVEDSKFNGASVTPTITSIISTINNTPRLSSENLLHYLDQLTSYLDKECDYHLLGIFLMGWRDQTINLAALKLFHTLAKALLDKKISADKIFRYTQQATRKFDRSIGMFIVRFKDKQLLDEYHSTLFTLLKK